MKRFATPLVLALACVPLAGCGSPAPPPERTKADRPTKLVPRQIIVMGEDGPRTVTVMEPEDGDGTRPGERRPAPIDPDGSMPLPREAPAERQP